MNRDELRRFIAVSAVVHLVGAAALIFVPDFRIAEPPGVIAVDLVSMSAPAPGPGPSAPKPKPRPPKKAPKILPTEPSTPKPQAKPKKIEKAEPKPVEEEPEDYSDVMAELRSELGETDAEPEREPVQTASLGGGGGPGRPVSPEVAAWIKAARIHIRKSWVVPPGFRNESLETLVEVELDGSGDVRGEPTVVRGSGNPWYDEGVVRSIRKASPLPAPPDAGVWTFLMVSDEF